MDIKLKKRKCRLILIFLAVCIAIMINLSAFIKNIFSEETPYENGTISLIFSEIYNSVDSLMLYTDGLYGNIREDSVAAEINHIKDNIQSFKNGNGELTVDEKYLNMSDEEIRQSVIKNFQFEIQEKLQSIERFNNVEFYCESKDGVLHFTNTSAESKEEFEEDTLNNYKEYIIFKSKDKVESSKNLKDITYNIRNLDRNHDFYVRISEPLKEGDCIYTIFKNYEKEMMQGYISTAGLIIVFIGTIILIISLKHVDFSIISEFKMVRFLSKAGIEVKLLIIGMIFRYEITQLKYSFFDLATLFNTVILGAGVYLLLLEVVRIKTLNSNIKKILLKESILVKAIKCLRKSKLSTILLLIIINIVLAVNFFALFMLFFKYEIMGTLVVILLINNYILSILDSINIIETESSNIAKGIYSEETGINDLKVFKDIGENLNNIQRGLKAAVDSAVKSEKMKAELITNVSHDLKTPLTSIISYVDLLSQNNVTEEQREKYLGILKDKSNRLKVLIEDLFEVSKASSGSVELNMINLDLVALLRQILGEFEDKIENSNLKIIRYFPKEKVIVYADGRKTFRIFQNLLSNIFKYSMEGSRVYIEVNNKEEYVEVIFKNTSKEELNFTEEEILQRFKRGDVSRSTEGSGLGLAIAKNLTEVQKGIFKIKIDGDLFKVIIKFKKS